MMEIDQVSDDKKSGGLGAGMMTLILGGVVLWVGKTTFEHAGQLAGVEQRLHAINGRHEGFQKGYDEIVRSLEDRTKSRFTREDADKIVWRINDVAMSHDAFKDKVYHEVMALRLQLSQFDSQRRALNHASLQYASGRASDEQTASRLAVQLQSEINSLRAEVDRLHRMISFNRGQTQTSQIGSPLIAAPAPQRVPDTVQR